MRKATWLFNYMREVIAKQRKRSFPSFYERSFCTNHYFAYDACIRDETNDWEWRISLTGKRANWNSTGEPHLFWPDVVASRKDDTRFGDEADDRYSGAFARLNSGELRTIYDSNRRYSRRPAVNANTRYTWVQCGTAWQIQSVSTMRTFGLCNALHCLPPPRSAFLFRDFESWQSLSASHE